MSRTFKKNIIRKGALYISPHSFHPSLKVESNMTMIIIMMRMYIIAFSNNLSLPFQTT